MRMVLDTNVVVSALLWQGSPHSLVKIGNRAANRFFTSDPLLEELKEILCQAKFASKIRVTRLSIEELIGLYLEFSIFVIPEDVPRIAPDPDDDVVIGTALAAKADFIVTGDKALLTVGEYGGVRIVSVHEALRAAALDLPPA